jgi:hypothetical protein
VFLNWRESQESEQEDVRTQPDGIGDRSGGALIGRAPRGGLNRQEVRIHEQPELRKTAEEETLSR